MEVSSANRKLSTNGVRGDHKANRIELHDASPKPTSAPE
jgi:hypothetical protein